MLKSIKERQKALKIPHKELLKEGFVSGVGWSFGVSIGFVLVSTILVLLLNFAGGLPLIGNFIANIVEETQVQLTKRTPAFLQN